MCRALCSAIVTMASLTWLMGTVRQEGEGNFVEVPKKPEGLSYDNDA